MPDGEGRKGAERPLRVAVRGTGRQPGEKRARRPRPTDRDVVAGAVHGPHGHAGPAEAALVHVAGHRASQAGEAEQPAAADAPVGATIHQPRLPHRLGVGDHGHRLGLQGHHGGDGHRREPGSVHRRRGGRK